LETPALTSAKATTYEISSDDAFVLSDLAGTSSFTPELGSSLTITGSSVDIGSDVLLPSGSLKVHSTTGSINVTGSLSMAGTGKTFFDLTRYTDGGDIELNAAGGSVNLAAGSLVSVAAASGGGSAGRLNIQSPGGAFLNDGTIAGQGGSGGRSGGKGLTVKPSGRQRDSIQYEDGEDGDPVGR
jgi:hypothetical protein